MRNKIPRDNKGLYLASLNSHGSQQQIDNVDLPIQQIGEDNGSIDGLNENPLNKLAPNRKSDKR